MSRLVCIVSLSALLAAAVNAAHEQSITIANPNKDALSDYAVRVVLDGAQSDFWAAAKPDGADLAMAGADRKPLPYYVESFSAADKKAVVWVKAPQIPAEGKADVLLLWGDGVTAKSDGKATFAFFEDFGKAKDLSGMISKLYNGKGKIALVDGWARVATDSGDFGDPGTHPDDSGAGLFALIPPEVGSSYAVDVRMRQQNWETGHHGGNQSVQIREDAEKARCFWWMVRQGDAMFLTSFCVEGPYHLFFDQKCDIRNPDKVVVRLTRLGDQYAWWGSDDLGETFTKFGEQKLPVEHKYIGLCDSYMGGYTEYGWLRIRKLAAAEPTVAFGKPQAPAAPAPGKGK
jgi:hypothetical protein